ncbi:carbohydrate-binding protein [Lutimonas halocynthiae]|uniref:carbohydrate-binding protein n=1 Tax=Lutimonas halocynthiae TaxID=1446477 RepID=UPI0025B30618|nr:carbohydrate-binding protein [Lutimonas halocynthiae]MDN3642847.1 carbohydrate-binding protein [Lutimonas halocynthiae]
MKRKLLLLIMVLTSGFIWSQNLKTEGKKIVDGNGNEVILKGAGLGGWMLMEGYMMQSSDVADTQHEFRERLEDLIGKTKTDEFFDTWLQNHVTKQDIDSLAKWGFNSVRLPMHYNLFTLPIEDEPVAGQNTFIDKGFNMVDELLNWCEANNMYLILDLHAAPGGQGANAAISDYDTDKPSLWESEENRAKTVALWAKLAERYKDEPWMGGYDLLNEVNWNLPGGTMLRTLYEEITTEIRKVDTKHIIFIEGNWFANDFTGLTPAWDNNMVYSFHKYWSFNDQASIQWVLDLREAQNVPLWMGEAGENSNTWFQEAISLFEKNGIGWSWWPMKRIETTVSPYSIVFSDGYKNILEYWRGNVAKPSEAEAYAAMMELANNTASNKCSYHKDVQDAQIRQITTDETKPYSLQKIPGTIHLSDYDLGKNNFAYYDIDAANYQLSTNQFQAWNSGWTYRNDGVDIEKNTDDFNSNGYHVGFTNKGEWINYTVQILESGVYKLEARIAGENAGGQFHISLNQEAITTTQTTEATGGWSTFATHTINDIALEAGTQVITLNFVGDVSFNISSITFSKTGDAGSLDATALNGELGIDESSIEVTINQDILASSLTDSKDSFSVTVNGIAQPISAISLADAKKRTILLDVDRSFLSSDEIKVSYDGTTVSTISGKKLTAFSELLISNSLPVRSILPGKIQAENFSEMSGLQTEDTSDDGGGKNLGYTDSGDYADYLVNIEEKGNFIFIARVASESTAGKIGIYILGADDSETELLSLDLPITGGWQQWENATSSITLTKGLQTLRMKVLKGGFNMNWMEIAGADADQDGVPDAEDECPNSNLGAVVNEKGCEVFSIGLDNFTIKVESETCQANNNGKITVSANKSFAYTADLSGKAIASKAFSTETEFTDLEAGSYTICFKAAEDDEFEQCFTVQVTEPETLQVNSSVNPENAVLTLKLSGSKTYLIDLNGKEFQTSESTFQIPLSQSINHLSVKTDLNCQGAFKELIQLEPSPVVYPNPVNGNYLYISHGATQDSDLEIYIYDVAGKMVKRSSKKAGKANSSIDVSALSSGLFIMKIVQNNKIFNYKILK